MNLRRRRSECNGKAAPVAPAPGRVEAKPPKAKREKQKNDPKYVAAARELRDRYLDEVNSGRCLPAANGKYDVSRSLESGGTGILPVHEGSTGRMPVPLGTMPVPLLKQPPLHDAA